MGAEAAVNAVYYNRLAAVADEAERDELTQRLRAEYEADIDVLRLAGELVIDDVVEPEDLRAQLIRRLRAAAGKDRGVLAPPARRHPGLRHSVSFRLPRVASRKYLPSALRSLHDQRSACRR